MLGLIIFLLILTILYYTLRYLWELIPIGSKMNRAVFITGCDTGFGRLLALKCVKNGIPTFAGCFTEEGQKSLRDESSNFPVPIKTVTLDITKDDSVEEAHKFVKANLEPGQRLWALVNNAGTLTSYGPDEWVSIEQYKRAIDVNCLGMIRCVHAFLPFLKESKGRVLSISSVLGRMVEPYRGPYVVSKFCVEAYMDVIRRELEPWGITCSIFEPSAFNTNFVNQVHLHKIGDGTWNNAKPEVQEQYGEEFKNEVLNDWYEGCKTGNPDLSWVIDSYYHAITARYPRNRYRIGWEAVYYYIPLSLVPTEVQDFLSKNWFGGLAKTLPAALKKKKSQ